jgi:pyridoxamine 5'-phosphate oxidase
VIDGRDKLEELFKSLLEKCKAQNPAKPIDWGGYEIEVDKIEFWQGRPGRLHDRIRFRKENNIWKRERLAP